MSQRLISKANAIIGYVDDEPVYGIFGAEGEEGEGSDGNGDGDSGDGDEDGGEGDGSDQKPDGKGDVISKEEYDKALARMKAADKNNAALQAKIKEYEDKDKTEIDKAKGDLEAVTAERDSLKEENSRLKFDNAFALAPKHSWQDPEIVLGLVRNHPDVTIEEDGTVKGLDKALDAIAKAKPFLLKDKDSAGDGAGSGPTGSTTGSTKKNDKNAIDEAALRKKYAALNI